MCLEDLFILIGCAFVTPNITVQYSAVQCSAVQYSTVQYNTALYSTIQYSTVQSRTPSPIVHSQLLQLLPEYCTLPAHATADDVIVNMGQSVLCQYYVSILSVTAVSCCHLSRQLLPAVSKAVNN